MADEKTPEDILSKLRALRSHAAALGLPLPDEGEAETAPQVCLSQPLHVIAAQTVQNICASRDPALFQQNGRIVTINEATGRTEEMTVDRFRSFVEHFQLVHKGWNKAGEPVRVHIPSEVARAVLASPDFLGRLPRVRGVHLVKMPVRRKPDKEKPCGVCRGCRDGGVCHGRLELLQPGYDRQSETFTVRLQTDELDYAENMPIAAAFEFLEQHFRFFPWGEKEGLRGQSFAIVLSMWLTLYGMNLLPPRTVTPMFLLNANLEGSGKSRLAEVVLYALYGNDVEPFDWMRKEEERMKQIDAIAMDNGTYIYIDNLPGNAMFRSVFLEQWLTKTTHGVRPFHTQQWVKVEKRAVVIATANRIEMHPETSRRALIVDLFATRMCDERDLPEGAVEITAEWLARPSVRGKLLACFWALLRFADSKGTAERIRPKASFEAWSRVIAQAVVECGFANPLIRRVLPDAGDTLSDGIRKLMAAVVEERLAPDGRQMAEVTLAEMVPVARRLGLFPWILQTTDDMLMEMGRKKGAFVEVPDAMGVLQDPDEEQRRQQAEAYFLDGKMRTMFGMQVGRRIRGQITTDAMGRRYEFGQRSGSRNSTFLVRRLD